MGLLRAISRIGKRPKMEMSTFNWRLRELIDWIDDMEEFFEFKEIEDLKRVKFTNTKLKGHASIWWEEIQLERGRRGKDKIARRDRIVKNLKRSFVWITSTS